jgi:DNA-directed RNA polymerase subunit RPC12/RpoP
MHIIGQRCPVCGKKGLVIGADDGLTFRPQGWLVSRLEGRQVACPHCGAVTMALVPQSVEKLRTALRKERVTETVTYHARPRKRRTPPAEPSAR